MSIKKNLRSDTSVSTSGNRARSFDTVPRLTQDSPTIPQTGNADEQDCKFKLHPADKAGSPKEDPRNEPSFPTGKDEPRQVTVVRESWIEYQTKEKRFSKALALALIALHKHLAKPGQGTFWTHMKQLKVPRMTAYRLMRLHGWKAEKRKVEKPKAMAAEEDNRIAKDQAITKAIGYFQRFEGETLRDSFERFCEELRRELFGEAR